MRAIQLHELADKLGATLHGDGSTIITGIAPVSSAKAGELTFLSNNRYQSLLANCNAGAVILTEADRSFCSLPVLVVNNVYLTYAKAAKLFDTTPLPADAISPRAVIADNVIMGEGVLIGANAVIETGVVLGNHVVIGAGCFIGKNTTIGDGTRLWANVSVYHNASIGADVLIHSNTVIGSDGFGYANEHGKWIKIPQLGSVIIGNGVEIGSCTTIDRGALGDTIISDGVIIDNQCQIAHNVFIGEHTAIAGGVVMAGSLKVGRHCMIGGASVFKGHMEICDNVTITGMSMVMRPITEPGIYSSGIPAQANKVWRKTTVLLMNINDIYRRVKHVEKQVNKK